MSLETVKTVVQIASTAAGAGAAISAVIVYRSNARRERARWAESLYARFYEKAELKAMRDKLDSASDDPAVAQEVANETPALTDYLNFFEFVAYLQSSEQLLKDDVQALFSYYLDCLRRHPALTEYIRSKDKGFEYLRKILFDE